MTTALAPIASNDEFETIQRTGRMLAASGYFDAKGDSAQAVAQMATKILAGRELGFGPFASVNGIHIISGKPTVSANLMAAAVKGHPSYDYRVREMDAAKCVIEFFQQGESLGVSSFTMKEAEAAKLTGKAVWQQFPRNMLFARALSNGVRWYCPDVFSGNAVYVPEELGADVDADGNVVDGSWSVQNAPQAQESTPAAPQSQNGANGAQDAATLPTATADEVFYDDESMAKPDQYELAIMQTWADAKAAQAWAVAIGACKNEHEARNSMKKLVDAEFGGSFTKQNAPDVYLAYLRHQLEKADLTAAEAQVTA